MAPESMPKKTWPSATSLVLVCDGRCDKAWGINGRPKLYYREEEGAPRPLQEGEEPRDPDDYVYVRDSKLGTAPGPGETVGVAEGSDLKPSATPLEDGERMNKWCARECERGGWGEAYDLEHPQPNYHRRPRT
jgi:hypothetical protein